MGFFVGQSSSSENLSNEKLVKYARAIELGRVVGRDIGGSDPERMAPPRVAEYVQDLFQQTSDIKVNVIKDLKQIEKDFPLFAAVNRAANRMYR